MVALFDSSLLLTNLATPAEKKEKKEKKKKKKRGKKKEPRPTVHILACDTCGLSQRARVLPPTRLFMRTRLSVCPSLATETA